MNKLYLLSALIAMTVSVAACHPPRQLHGPQAQTVEEKIAGEPATETVNEESPTNVVGSQYEPKLFVDPDKKCEYFIIPGAHMIEKKNADGTQVCERAVAVREVPAEEVK